MEQDRVSGQHCERLATGRETLVRAEHIFVIGYSLPQTDQFFGISMRSGTIGKARVKTFMVVDPSEDVARRFENLLGPTARYRFQHLRGTFASNIGNIQNALGVK